MPPAAGAPGAQHPEAIRVALVMNGGVSLAVWMGGVTHEIDRLRRSGRSEAVPASPAWRALCEQAERSIEVDLVAGTSTGGLNGTLLATAIARGAPLPHLQELWADTARLVRRRLLHTRTPRPANSVLDGGFFAQTLRDRLAAIEPAAARGDVTLLVTASALHGSTTAVVDAMGKPFTAGDHRRVYRFRRRGAARRLTGEGNLVDAGLDDFHSAGDELAVAARASAGFPFAFEPTRETEDLHEKDVSGARGEPTWLVDGGVLDNAPFRPLLAELRDRPVAEPGQRWIVYVVPTTHTPPLPGPDDNGAEPPKWTTLPGRIWSLSRESDLRDDVAALGTDWRDGRVKALPPEVLIAAEAAGRSPIEVTTSARALFPAYQRTKLAGISRALLEDGSAPLTDRTVSDAKLDQLLERDLCWIPDQPTSPARPMGEQDEPSWQWGIRTARRIARWLSRDARASAAFPEPLADPDRVQIAGIEEALLALEAAEPSLRDPRVRERAEQVGRVQAVHEATVASGVLPLVLEQMSRLIDIWAAGRELTPQEAWQWVLGAEVLTNALSWDREGSPPAFAFHLLSPGTDYQGTLLDLSEAAGSPGWPDSKLYGTRFGHFGAFGARGFRDWDWMWGRLDGALTLGRALLAERGDLPPERRRELLDDVLLDILQTSNVAAADLGKRTRTVCRLTPGQLVATARHRGETDFNGVIDDIAAVLENNDLLVKPVRGGLSARVGARLRGWGLRTVIRFGARRAKCWVGKQRS